MSAAIEKASITLVDRARHGDQNAMGMIAAIRENAKRGNPKARTARDAMMRYIKKNPPKRRTTFGQEPPRSFQPIARVRLCRDGRYGQTIVRYILEMGPSVKDSRLVAHILATGKPVDRVALRQVMKAIPYEIRPSFRLGFQRPGEALKMKGLRPDEVKCVQIGYILGLCHCIQEMRQPNASIKRYSASVGWELGER